MSEVEQLAEEYYKKNVTDVTVKTFLAMHKDNITSAYLCGYAKGETDEKFRTKPVVTKDSAEFIRQKEQLVKAKNLIKRFSEFVNNEVEYDPEHPQEHTDLWNELCKEVEQFLKENE